MTTIGELTKGLSPTQKEAFEKLVKNGPSNSYGLGVRLTTMHALEKKGLVKSKWTGVHVMAEINLTWYSLYRVKK